MSRTLGLVVCLLLTWTLSISQLAMAQWVGFTEETATRLSLVGIDINDAEEKDIAVGDLNRDGLTDLIVVRKAPFSVAGPRRDILLLNENGTLVDRTAEFAPGFLTTLTDSRDVFVGDLDGDAWQDVVIVNTFSEQPSFYRNLGTDDLANWLGLVDESSTRFPVITVANMPGPKFCAVAGGDVTGDGAPDLYFSNYNNTMGVGTTDVLLINDGTGHFTDETSSRLGDFANVAFGTSVEIADMDNDGDNDVVRISTLYAADPFDARWLGVFYNDGTGIFNSVPFQEFPNTEPYMIAVADFNNDGLLDVYQESDVQDSVLFATGITPNTNITFDVREPMPSPRTMSFGGNTKYADMDNDGDLDVGVAPIDVDIQNCGTTDRFSLLRNSGGSGRFGDPWMETDDQNIHIDPHDFAFLDVNNDGCMDIFMGLCAGWRVFIQTGCTSSPAGSVPAAGSSLTVDPAATPGQLLLTWLPSCQPGDDYGIYRGRLGEFTSHEEVVCTTAGLTSAQIDAGPGDHYYIVVPNTGTNDGSYGVDNLGFQRLPGPSACYARAISSPCP